MKELKRKRLIRRQQLEDVPELIQQIQSLLPAKDAAGTCVLSKSWLRAWSTIPTLRFCRWTIKSLSKQERSYMRFIRRTIRRYHQDNIPIITCDLYFAIHKQKSATRVEKLIKSVASKSCLKELHLKIFCCIASFTLPDEIFSSGNLNTLSIKLENLYHMKYSFEKKCSLHISSNPLINCVNLRVLELLEVHISNEAFHNLVSTCMLLEKINLEFIEGLTKIKLNNLRCLQQLKIAPGTPNDNVEVYNVEIYDVPSLRSFNYDELMFHLDSLTLILMHPTAEIMDIRCATLQRLKIESRQSMGVKVQVDAPKLLCFLHESNYMPSLLFPTVAPEQIEVRLRLSNPIDHWLFLNIWETLNLSSKFNIEIQTFDTAAQVPFKIDDVRTRVPFPATNVKNLSFQAFPDNGCNGKWEKLTSAPVRVLDGTLPLDGF
ncbi:F-box protein-like protein [Tanacetum coccineum]|uniref:F-box protein-like protein n=1 Tax=Tanacetum coccineum TaxID=301880 RepID=A0ABQ5GGY7_9ASTR